MADERGETKRCGILGSVEVEVDGDGFVDIPVIVQDSGLIAGAPPAELRIHAVGAYGDDEFNQAFVARLNRRTDLPFRLGIAKVKIVGELQQITDDDLKELEITPLPDD